MAVLADTIEVSAIEMKIALSDIHPDSAYGDVPVLDQQDALEANRAFDDGVLAEVPQALAAYVDHQQHFAL
jgi:hypothetical protein